MASKKSPSSARLARRDEALPPFLAELGRAAVPPAKGTLEADLASALRNKRLQQCFTAFWRASSESLRPRTDQRMTRLRPPAKALPPVA